MFIFTVACFLSDQREHLYGTGPGPASTKGHKKALKKGSAKNSLPEKFHYEIITLKIRISRLMIRLRRPAGEDGGVLRSHNLSKNCHIKT
jgi:hypothetical protein